MKKAILLLTILFCYTFNVFAQEQIDSEEYDVFKVVLAGGKSIISNFTIIDSGLNRSMKLAHLKRELSEIESETRKSYNTRNQRRFELQDTFGSKSTVAFISDEELKIIFDKLGEDRNELTVENALIEKYGSGTLISFSRVGFNKNKTQALVAINSNIGLCGTCSTNYYVILSKENGEWMIRKKVMSSIS